MLSNPKPNPTYTVEEYLAIEAETGIKHEYIDGEIYMMSGGTFRHSRIIFNLGLTLGTQLRGKPCQGLESNMRVKVSETRYVYPDLSVVCGEPQFSDDNQTMLTNPTMVVEVLSSSSEQRDMVTKMSLYRNIESVRTYLIIKQDTAHVMLYIRQDDGWLLRDYIGLDATVPLDVIACQLPLSELYETVTLDDETAPDADTEA